MRALTCSRQHTHTPPLSDSFGLQRCVSERVTLNDHARAADALTEAYSASNDSFSVIWTALQTLLPSFESTLDLDHVPLSD
mmetsp:Transcript_27481/g.34147  ORF Transcript_27481/g.34147 Transcript_27481/m.34147 type:complete len:81 (-) Transcript_27481:20-262(-)